MAIYNVQGNNLSACYSQTGSELNKAYNVNGSQIWTKTSTGIKVATYNVGDWGWGAGLIAPEYKSDYLALQNTIFTNIDADICALQEWNVNFCTDGTLSSVVTSEYFDYLNGTGYWAIGSNIAFSSFNAYNYSTVSVSGDYAKYEKAYFNIGGIQVCLFNVHFDTDQTKQEAQCSEILTLANQENYVIICGDFNTVIESLSDTDYTTMIKPFIDDGYTDANCGAFGIFQTYYRTADPSDSYKPATDHIIVSSNITITNAYIDTTKLTDGLSQKIDHIPLVAELSIA